MTVLVTGGASFIGLHLADRLLPERHEVRVDAVDAAREALGARVLAR